MRFPDATLDQIRAAFRLSDYIGKTVPLKKVGKEYQALSPFVKEKTPSFFVNDEKQFFHCFASQRHGDIIGWLVEHQGLTFVEAVKRLAEEAGIDLPERDAHTADQDRRRARLTAALEAAQALFTDNLLSDTGREARAYLEGRGLGPEEWERFGIGYALDGRIHLKEVLVNHGAMVPHGPFATDELIAGGLLISTEDGRPSYDRYRHRIMFPIRDPSGRLISFGGRALDPKQKAKYLNGPDTELFDKGRNLYGLDMSRRVLAAGAGPLLVVEGYMDVIAGLRAGVASCAPMGTSLTEAQLALMWRHHQAPTICLDGDRAGRQAAGRVMDMAIPNIGPGRSLNFLIIQGGKDPDEVLRARGAEALRSQVSRPTPLVDAIFQREVAAGPLDTPEQRTDLRERLRKIVRAINDRDLSREYGEAFRVKLEAARRQPSAGQQAATVDSVESARALRGAIPPTIGALAYWMLKDPARALERYDQLDRWGLGHPPLEAMISQVLGWLIGHDPDAEALAQFLSSRGFGGIVSSIKSPEDFLSQRADWLELYDRRVRFLELERAVQEAKVSCRTPAAMQTFLTLKTQRDQARRAL